MRSFTLIVAALLASGCTSRQAEATQDAGPPEPITELVVNVEVYASSLTAFIREAERSCQCGWGEWPDNGDCYWSSDTAACHCDPFPATCVRRIALTRPGLPDVEGDFSPPMQTFINGGLMELGDQAQLSIEGCGSSLEVPITYPTAPRPIVGVSSNQEEVLVQWESLPLASFARVEIGDGEWTFIHCHDNTGTVSFPVDPRREWGVTVQPFGEPIVHRTELGTVTLWAGERQSYSVPLPVNQ